MWIKLGICCILLVVLDSGMAEEKDAETKLSRVKRAFRKRKGSRVAYKIIDEHHDHGDYHDFNFFGNYYDGGHDDYHSDYGHDYNQDHDYGHDFGHDYGHSDYHEDDHEDYGHSASDYHDFGGNFHDYGHEYDPYGHEQEDYHDYGKRTPSYKRVSKKRGYKKFYKPKVIVIKKIVPLSTTTTP